MAGTIASQEFEQLHNAYGASTQLFNQAKQEAAKQGKIVTASSFNDWFNNSYLKTKADERQQINQQSDAQIAQYQNVVKQNSGLSGFFHNILPVAKSASGLVGGLSKNVVQSIENLPQTVAQFGKEGWANMELGFSTEYLQGNTKYLSDQMKLIAQLPTQEQRHQALLSLNSGKLHNINQKSFDDAMQIANDEYKKLGIKSTDNNWDILRKASPEIVNDMMTASMVVPMVGGAADIIGGLAKPLVEGMSAKLFGTAIASDAINAATVKVATGVAADVTEGTATVVGDKLINEAADETAQITVRHLTDNGIKILGGQTAKEFLGKVITTSSLNSAQTVLDDWAKGNNFKTNEERTKALQDAGMSFLQGAAMVTMTEVGMGALKGVLEAPSNIKSAMNSVRTTINTLWANNADIRAEDLQKQYDTQMSQARQEAGTELAKNRNDQVAKQNIEDIKNFAKENTQTFNTTDEQMKALKDNHNVNMIAHDPSEHVKSGFKVNKDGSIDVHFRKGNLPDALTQLGKALPNVLKNNGLDIGKFKDEIQNSPSSGLGIDDSLKTKFQTIVGNMLNNPKMREDHPKIALAVDGVMGAIQKVTTKDGIKAWVKDNYSQYYASINHIVGMFSASTEKDPLTGKNKTSYSDVKNSVLWGDIYNMLYNSGVSKSEIPEELKTLGAKVSYMQQLKNTAESLDNTPGQGVFNAAQDASVNGRPTFNPDGTMNSAIDNSIAFWKNHLNTFYKNAKVPSEKSFGLSPTDFSKPIPDTSTPTTPAGAETPNPETTTPETATTETPKAQPKITDTPENISEADKAKLDATSKEIAHSIDPLPDEHLKELSAKAANAVKNDYEGSKQMIYGTKDMPEDVANEQSFKAALSQAVIKEAGDRGDTETQSLVTALYKNGGKEASQAMGARRLANGNSLGGILQKALDFIQGDRQLTIAKNIETDTKNIATELKNSAMKDSEGSSLIDKLTCG